MRARSIVVIVSLSSACSSVEPRVEAPRESPSPDESAVARELPPSTPLPPLARGGTSLCARSKPECEQRCAAGNALSCARRARLDQVNAADWWKKSCDLGYVEACIELALGLAEESASNEARVRAEDLMARVCASGDGRGCAYLARTVADERFAALYAKRGCELGSSEACLEAAPSNLAMLGAAREMLRGDRPQPAPEAQASLACEPPTTAVAAIEDHPATFCAAFDGTKHGAYVAWQSLEDRAEGSPSGAQRIRTQYRMGKLEGPYEQWNADGELTAKGAYAEGARTGAWSLRTSAGHPETGTFERGQREGVWVTTTPYARTKTPYVDDVIHGIESEENLSTRKTVERAWAFGKACDTLKGLPIDSKEMIDCAEVRRAKAP